MTIEIIDKVPKAVTGDAPFFRDAIPFEEYVAGRCYPCDMNYALNQLHTVGADKMHLSPFVPKETTTFTSLLVVNASTTNSGHKARLGLYDDDNGLPGSLIVDAGEITLDTSRAFRSLAISEELQKHTQYWTAIVGDTASTSWLGSSPTSYISLRGWLNGFVPGSTDYTAMIAANYDVNHTYGALPAQISGVLSANNNSDPIHMFLGV